MAAQSKQTERQSATTPTTSTSERQSHEGGSSQLKQAGGYDAQAALLKPGGALDTPVQMHQDANSKKKKSPNAEHTGPKNATAQEHEQLEEGPKSFADLKKEVGACGDWEAVKKKWLPKKKVMERLCAFRKKYVDDLVKYVERLAIGEKKATFNALALGSTALTSDYDITFSGSAGIFAVKTFNEKFGKEWGGKEAGTVFDTNVYAQNFLQDKKPGSEDEQVEPVKGGATNVAADAAYQDVMALVKVRKNMSASGWTAFTGKITAQIADTARKTETQLRFDKADGIYTTTYAKELVLKMCETKEGLQAVETARKKGMDDIKIAELLAAEAPGIAAANRLYEEKLGKVETLVGQRDTLQKEANAKKGSDAQAKIDKFSVKIRSAHSDALLFANEPYFAGGTIRHVVGMLQAKWNINVSGGELLNSLVENFGDIQKEGHHLASAPFAKMGIKTSKYAFRFLDACKRVGDKDKKIVVPSEVAKMHPAMEKVLAIRQGDGEWAKAEDKAKNEAAVKLLNGIGMTDAGSYLGKLEKIMIAINVSARSQGASGT